MSHNKQEDVEVYVKDTEGYDFKDSVVTEEDGVSDELSLLETFQSFIKLFTSLENDEIYRGYQNNIKTPQSQSYAVYFIKESKQLGSNVKRTHTLSNNNLSKSSIKTDEENTYILNQITIQVNVYAKTEYKAHSIISSINHFFKDPMGIDYFNKRSIFPLYSSTTTNITDVDENQQYLMCFTNNFIFSFWSKYTQPIETFSSIHAFVENIDVHHFEKVLSKNN